MPAITQAQIKGIAQTEMISLYEIEDSALAEKFQELIARVVYQTLQAAEILPSNMIDSLSAPVTGTGEINLA